MKEEIERTPLKIIIQNFLNHIENLESQKIEDSYEKEFQELKYFSEILKTSKQYSCSEGEKEVNRKKNRYKDILPFDSSRVILGEYAGIPGSDYINANYIKGASGSPAYIASQGPLPHTVNDFWRMIVECEVQVIVMACNQEEAGKHKCENYWVEREGEEKQFGMVAIRLIKASVVCPDFLVRTMKLKYINSQTIKPEERTICQFHYSAWPDHGVPPLVRPLLDMVRLVRDTQASETLPVLIHCSAGCGRTGTICAIDYVWGLLRAGKLTKDFSLYKLVREMRTQRIAMVQTKEQYVLVHQAVRELFNEQLRMIDSHPYENIDSNGMPIVEPIEPTYVTFEEKLHIEEKQDNKEKETKTLSNSEPPPLPRKRRTKLPASKQEKEVENLTEKRRLTGEHCSDSDTGSNSSGLSGTRPQRRINRLKALFERIPRDGGSKNRQRSSENYDEPRTSRSQQVSRSHSLGALRYSQLEVEVPKEENNPQLSIKRSKSLKVLGSTDRYKLVENIKIQNNEENFVSRNPISNSTGSHIINNASNEQSFYLMYNENKFQGDQRRRRSLESVNLDEIEFKPTTLNEKIPPGLNAAARSLLNKCTSALEPSEAQQRLQNLGIRERSNSFRQAIGKSTKEYEAIWLISNTQNRTSNKGNSISQNSKKNISTSSKHNIEVTDLLLKKANYNFPNRRAQTFKNLSNNSQIPDQVKLAPQLSFPQSSDKEHRQSLQNQHMKINVHSSKPTRLNATLSPCRTYVDIYPSPNESSSSEIKKQETVKTKDEPNLVEIKSMKELKVGFHKRRSESMKFSKPTINRSEEWKTNSNVNSNSHLISYKSIKPRSEPSTKESNISEIYPSCDLESTILDDQLKHASKSPKKMYTPPIYSGKPHMPPRKSTGNEVNKFYLSPEKESSEARMPINFQNPKPIYVKNDEHGEFRTEPIQSIDPNKYPYMYDLRYKNSSNNTPMIEDSRIDQSKSQKIKKSFKFNPTQEERDLPNIEINMRQPKDHLYPQQDALPISVENRQSRSYNIPSSKMQNHSSIPNTNLKTTSETCYLNIPEDPCRIPQSPQYSVANAKESDVVSYGLVAGLQLRKGSRDDLAICPTVPPRVRRHASVVLVRHNLIESNEASSSSSPLSVWNSKESEKPSTNSRDMDTASFQPDSSNWKHTPVIDLDTVAASIKQQSTSSTPLARALKALHLRKSSEGKKQATPEKSAEIPIKKQQYL